MMFNVEKELCIGRVIEVNGTNIKVELNTDLASLTKSFKGRVYSIGQMASIIKIHFGRMVIFCNVSLLRMRSEISLENNTVAIGDDSRILEAEIIGQGQWNNRDTKLDFNRGISLYPLPQQSVYLMTDEELNSLYSGAELNRESGVNPLLPIGTYVGTNQTCNADINKLFGNHCAILGSTGSGKSGTVASILHSILAYGDNVYPRIIMIDPHGEYGKAFTGKSHVFKAYSEFEATEEDKVIQLPYWLMTSDEFRSFVIGKTEHEATTQNNIVYEAISYARMIQAGIIKPLVSEPTGGMIADLCEGKTEVDRLNFNRDLPIPFTLEDFTFHIDKVQGRKTDVITPKSATDRSSIESILKKLRVMRSNPLLNFLMAEYQKDTSVSVSTAIGQLIGKIGSDDDINKNIRIVDISGLPNEVAGLLTAMISRLIFEYKIRQDRNQREKDPVLLVFEEAHRYVPNTGEVQYKEAQNAIRRIAKEGRKYGIGLMLVSQRPSDVEKTVLSQCCSWIILRLTNASDQNYVSSFIPDNLVGLTKLLSSLTRREAIFVGEACAIPSRIMINKLNADQLPDSSDIDFANGWTNEPLTNEEINEVIEKWIVN